MAINFLFLGQTTKYSPGPLVELNFESSFINRSAYNKSASKLQLGSKISGITEQKSSPSAVK